MHRPAGGWRDALSELFDFGQRLAQLLVQLGILRVQIQALVQCLQQATPNLQEQKLHFGVTFLLAELIDVAQLVQHAHQMQILDVMWHARPG